MRKMKLVVVGNGMAGVRTLEELLKLAPDLYDITVFGAEPHANYNRILLSPVLAGEMTLKTSSSTMPTGTRRTASGCTWARRSSRSTARRARSSPTTAPRSATTACCSPPAPTRSCCRSRARTCTGVLTYRDIADTEAMIDGGGPAYSTRGRDRRRPARPGSRERPQAARHGRDRRAPDAVAHGAPARSDRGEHAAEVARSKGPAVPAARAQTSEIVARRGPRPAARALQGRRTRSPPISW